MRPKDLSLDECRSVLSEARYGRLGLSSGGQPYVIPMSYVYHEGRIYLHSRGEGKKVRFVRDNPRVCFQVDRLSGGRWSSVLAYGRARLSSDLESKMRMFDAFIGKDMQGHGGKGFSREDIGQMDMTIWEIEVEELTGREGIW